MNTPTPTHTEKADRHNPKAIPRPEIDPKEAFEIPEFRTNQI